MAQSLSGGAEGSQGQSRSRGAKCRAGYSQACIAPTERSPRAVFTSPGPQQPQSDTGRCWGLAWVGAREEALLPPLGSKSSPGGVDFCKSSDPRQETARKDGGGAEAEKSHQGGTEPARKQRERAESAVPAGLVWMAGLPARATCLRLRPLRTRARQPAGLCGCPSAKRRLSWPYVPHSSGPHETEVRVQTHTERRPRDVRQTVQ